MALCTGEHLRSTEGVMYSKSERAPSSPRRLDDPRHWHAEEARRTVEEMNNLEAREAMMRVAEKYEGLATKPGDKGVC
jgi:hypothetical protein